MELDKLTSFLISQAFAQLKKYLLSIGRNLLITEYDIQEAINSHLKYVDNWSNEISFKDLIKPISLNDSFIPLNLNLTPKRYQYAPDSMIIPFEDLIIDITTNLVILGQPGAGKTTSMKYICQLLLHGDSSCISNFNFPFVIRLRELNSNSLHKSPILNRIFQDFSIKIDFNNTDIFEKQHIIDSAVLSLLDSLNLLLVLDGFDEISEESLKTAVIEDIQKLAFHFNNSVFILTSRSADYKFHIEKTITYEISSLTDKQIYEFSYKWLKSTELSLFFLDQLKHSPFYDTSVRPLTLAHLCAIFFKTRSIPDKPKSVYKKIINLLLDEWTEQNSLKRISRYSDFGVDRKFEFLSHLAYLLTVHFNKTIFNREEISYCYFSICDIFNLPLKEINIVIDELESHNGIFLQSGYDSYEFSHKSLQEYLVAEYIVHLPSVPLEKNLLLGIPNELAITISLSSNATKYFLILIFERLYFDLFSMDFWRSFCNRLVLEAPNFSPSPILGLALLFIYTVYTDKLSEYTGEDYNLFLLFFKKLLSIDTLRKSLNLFYRFDETEFNYTILMHEYNTSVEYFGYDKNNIIRKKSNQNESSRQSSDNFPDYIYHNPKVFEYLMRNN